MRARAPINAIVATAASATTAFAANGAQADQPGIHVWAFMGFAAVIVAGQLVPAAILVFGAVKALFTRPEPAKTKV